MWYRQMEEKYGYPIEFLSPKAGVDYNRKELYFERRGNVNESLRKEYIWILKKKFHTLVAVTYVTASISGSRYTH